MVECPEPTNENLGQQELNEANHHSCTIDIFSVLMILNETGQHSSHTREQDVDHSTDGGLQERDFNVGFLTAWQLGVFVLRKKGIVSGWLQIRISNRCWINLCDL